MRDSIIRNNRIFYCMLGLLSLLLFFQHFYGLNMDSVKSWDESLYGVNGLEMLRTGEWIVNTYGYKPDYFNLKPILWPQFVMLGFKIFGQNLIGLRIFSPISMLLCAAICAFYVYRRMGRWGALFVLLCFAANRHLLLYHCARSGDADSLYILFSTCAFLALADTEKGSKRLYLCSLWFSLAFLTKGFHAGAIVAVILIYLFLSREYKEVRLRVFGTCFLIAVMPIIGWGSLRYVRDGATFIKTMFGYDLYGSLSIPLEGHAGNALFYIKNEFMRSPLALACLLIIIPVVLMNLKEFLTNKRRLALFLSALLPFVMFSLVKTKLIWYVYLCYPPLIVLAADCLEELIGRLDRKSFCIPIILAVILCFGTASLNAKTVYFLRPQDKVLIAIQDMLKKETRYDGETIYQHYVDPETELLHREWRPRAFFTFELYSSLRPKDGNVDEWKKDKRALLFTSFKELNNLRCYNVRASYGDYVVLEHR